ncbi:GGDEF domain-containing protein [Luteimonas sp. RD2P54]|uniref:GGDEF domain-containing protein n=1 Tax=Luteimonas endophytica TaxID=3042023 RepID=A0ABT6J9X8_9GAMM|nr:GGDEF domain-containing protein [Luteimonas endophytica]MDH5823629.1 GGDEF domain-containing protein [Luteimonas endophytica]
MNSFASSDDASVRRAREELAGLQQRIELARAELGRLQRLAGAEERRVDRGLLLETIEQMVASTLRAQLQAETTASRLEEVARSAERDELTGLPNRALLLDRLSHAIANAKRHGTRLALLFVDIDDFKRINDTLGHASGDEALRFAARCLVSAVREADTVSRYGGDEFLILLDEVSGPSGALVVARKVIAALDAPTRLGDRLISLKGSIGISIYPDDGQDDAALIAQADAAMYLAKRRSSGSIQTAFSP